MDVLDEKYAAMNQGGVAKLLSGQFDKWQGLPAKDAPNLILAVHFKPSRALDDVIETLRVAAVDSGIDLCLAGRDYPFHVTIQQGVSNDQSQALPNLASQFEYLCGMSFEFGHVIAGPNILLASSTIPLEVGVVRVALSHTMSASGMAPSPISILHATAARITNVSDVNVLPDFVRLVSILRDRVLQCPLELTVSHVSFGTVAELLQQPVAA